MDRGKKTVARGSVPRKRTPDLGSTSPRTCDRKGSGERPGFTAEQRSSRATVLPENGKKKSVPQRSQGKEKSKNQDAASNQVPTNPKTSGKLIPTSKTGKPSHPNRYGLGKLSCSSSSVSDMVLSDTSKVAGSSSSSSSRSERASGVSGIHDLQPDRSSSKGRKRVASLSRNPGEPDSPDSLSSIIEEFTEVVPSSILVIFIEEISVTLPFDLGLVSSISNRRLVQVLLSLERLEREGALTHERLTATLVFDGFSVTDQYRDLRLDIDHMSYEELLDLEERMGTVSTALSEEELADCLVSSVFGGEDSNCTVCQEEYEEGEEVGQLHCGHRFHRDCILQWLGRKNWCPVCKLSAAK